MLNRFKLLIGLSTILALVACGGPGYVSGSGKIHSLGGLKDAKLKFSANSCDGIENSFGKIKYKDKAAIDWEAVKGVKFKGTVDSTYYCSLDNDPSGPECVCNEGYQEINFSYESTNNNAPGTGEGIACMADVGGGSADGDDDDENKEDGLSGIAQIEIISGPYDGYFNAGATDVTQHDCNAINTD